MGLGQRTKIDRVVMPPKLHLAILGGFSAYRAVFARGFPPLPVIPAKAGMMGQRNRCLPMKSSTSAAISSFFSSHGK
jgi:hypothetical protein